MSFWEPTQAALGPLITHPPLTEKNLSRPPFRFIHDIVSNINSTHGTFVGVFPSEFDDSGAIDTKEKKIQYLEMLVNAVEVRISMPVTVNVKKVVTGSEVEATNIFLQQIAQAVQVGIGGMGAPPPPPPPPLDASDLSPPPPPPPLPPPADLPKPKLRPSNPMLDAFKIRLLQVTGEFGTKISSYGFQTSPESLPPAKIVSDIGQLSMDLAETLDTEPSRMPEAALATAIQRQMEAIFQVSSLIDDNNLICNQLVEQMMSGLQ